MAGIEGPDSSTAAHCSGDALVYHRCCLERKYPMLVRMVGVASIDLLTIPIWKELDVAKIAVLGDTPVDRVIVNFTLGLSNFRCPARYFTDPDTALHWLQEGDHA